MSPTFLRGRRARDRSAPTPDVDAADAVEDGDDGEGSGPALELCEAQSVSLYDPDQPDRVWVGRVRSSLRDTFLVEMIDEQAVTEMPAELEAATAVESAFATFATRVVRSEGASVTFEMPRSVARSNRRSLFRVPVALAVDVEPDTGSDPGSTDSTETADPAHDRSTTGAARPTGTTLDIGHGGIRARLAEPLASGDVVRLRIALPDGGTIGPSAVATWSFPAGPGHATGLQFLSISNEDTKRLGRAVGQLQKRLVPRVATALSGSYTRPGSPASHGVSIVELSPGAVTVVAVDDLDLGTAVVLLFFVTGVRFSVGGTVVESGLAGDRHRLVVALDPVGPDAESALRAALDGIAEE